MRLTPLALAMMASSVLVGCGGSSDSNDNTNQGPGPVLPLPPELLNFAIVGIATDAPVANAAVEVQIGGQVYSVKADDSGIYQLAFEYEAGSLGDDEMVVITATGEGSQDHIRLISQLGSFKTIQAQAGDNGVLEPSESSRTSITQISTALHLLAQDTGVSLSDDAALAEAEAQIESAELLELAALIKVLADNPEFTPEQGTILELLTPQSGQSVEEAIEDYLLANGLMDDSGQWSEAFAAALAAATTETLNDQAVTLAFQADELVGLHVVTETPAPGWVAGSGTLIQFYQDGRAEVQNPDATDVAMYDNLAADWQVTEQGQVVLTYDDDARTMTRVIYLSHEEIADLWGDEVLPLLPEQYGGVIPIVTQRQHVRDTFTRLTEGEVSTVAMVSEGRILLALDLMDGNWVGELPSYPDNQQMTYSWRLPPQVTSLWETAPTGTWVLPLPKNLKYLYEDAAHDYSVAQQVTLSDDGDVLDAEGKVFGEWRFADGLLSLDTVSGWSVTILPYAEVDGLLSAAVRTNQGTFRDSEVHWIAQLDQATSTLEQDLVQSRPFILNAWVNTWQASVSEDGLLDPAAAIWGYLMQQDGAMYRVYPEQWSDGGSAWVPGDYYFYAENQFNWTWQKEGAHEYSYQGERDYGSMMMQRKRNWTSIRTLPDGRHLVLERSYVSMDYYDNPEWDAEGVFILPRINVLAPLDLSRYDEMYQRSESACSLPWFESCSYNPAPMTTESLTLPRD
ncbi:hypothetical protein KUV56_04895 [Ferrimonas balearica]|uniref:hypothetical protein n=1 Tax=Ferrimonas balearica TaxID=44012 RepID=UPI001C57B4E8|nr:hypothetical protein [Ferrimonas balearica]MBW3138870.1 hypothetical protein [Ferrimonas balearica]